MWLVPEIIAFKIFGHDYHGRIWYSYFEFLEGT
jgi:hypothetical protein